MHKIELSDKQLTYIVLALESYAKELTSDEEDAGPSMADSLFVADLAKRLRQHVSK
jgi:hypothetical protein